jgi:stearoyl-CoA desaturase (Delta-9 desaturase)
LRDQISEQKPTALYPSDREWEKSGRAHPVKSVLIGGPGARRKHYDMTALFLLHGGTAAGGLWYLLTQPTNWTIWSLFIIGYLLTNFGFSVGFHRYFTHKAFETSKAMRYVLGITGQMSAMTSVKYWSADHRRHHAFSDRPGDVHSPVVDGHGRPMGKWKGFAISHFGWLWDNAHTDMQVFGKGLVDDEVVEFCHRTRWHWIFVSYVILPIGWALAFGRPQDILGCILLGTGLRNFIFLNGVMGTDSLAHMFGYRRFDDDSTSTNNWFIAILTLGDGWHNNHHGQPRAASNQMAWWELDFNGWSIFAMEKMGLVWNVQRRAKGRHPIVGQAKPASAEMYPEPQQMADKPMMFPETAKARSLTDA